MNTPQSAENQLTLAGYICEAGDFNVVQEKHGPGRSRGVVIERANGDLTIMGLSKSEVKTLAAQLRAAVTITIKVEAT